jgi:SAM-dependent methyltransferase
VADIPFDLAEPLAQRLRSVADIEGKIPRALEALGPLAGRRVGFLDVPPGRLLDSLCADVAEAVPLPADDPLRFERADGSLDAVVSLWSGFRGVDEAALAETDRVLAPGGRLLVVHDYGRDEVSGLVDPDAPQYRTWSRREGPFLRGGAFKIRVLHCFWTFDTVEQAQAFLGEAFGERGAAAGAVLKRPRLSWNVAVYHRWRGGVEPEGTALGHAVGAA